MWETAKLGEICNFEGGSQPPKKEFLYEPADGYVRFLQIRDFKSDKNITYIPIAKKNRLCSEDDILIGRYGASVGQILDGLSGAYNVALMKTIPNEEFISKGWLHAYLTSPLFQKPLIEVSSRSAQNGFSKDDIYDFDVPLPPLAEQQRIVAKLDAAFAEIDEVSNTNHLKITETNTLTNLVFDKWLANIRTHKKISELCDFLNGYAFKSGDAVEQSNVQLLRMGNLYGNKLDLNRKPIFYPNNFADEYQKYTLNAGDIIMTLTGTVGKEDYGYAIEVPKTDKKLLLNQRVLKFYNFDSNLIHLQFFLYILHSKQFLKTLYKTANGTRQANLSSDTIKELEIPLPSISEQEELVDKIKSLMTNKDIVASNAERNIQNCSQIKAAILAQELQSEAA